jgi:hypothetical protein
MEKQPMAALLAVERQRSFALPDVRPADDCLCGVSAQPGEN